jgi:dihydroorotase-like cyclic amidohydrolase
VNARNLWVLPGAIDGHTHMEAPAFGLRSRDTFESGTRAAADIVRRAKAHGVSATAETCPHYVLLDERVYARADGRHFSVIPPLRTPEDQSALWAALSDGAIDSVATDHCPFVRAERTRATTLYPSRAVSRASRRCCLSCTARAWSHEAYLSAGSCKRCARARRAFSASRRRKDE